MENSFRRKSRSVRLMLNTATCLAITLILSQLGVGQSAKSPVSSAPVVRGELGTALDGYMKRLEGYGFSGALLVAKDGQITLAKGYGLANRERSIPATADTLFEVASLNKQFTATAIMKLEQEGKLTTDDPLTKFFDNVPDDKKGITLHQLMTHSAGFPNEFGRPGADYSEDPYSYYFKDRDDFVRAILAAPLEYAPGAKTLYSNPSYSLTAAIIEKVSGQKYETFIKQKLLVPAGLKYTGFYDDVPTWDPRLIARGFNGTVEIEPASYEHGWGTIGAGKILTSVNDLYRWEQALRGENILTSKSKAKLFGVRVPSGGGFDYAYGWRFHRSPRGTDIIWASGLVPEFSAMFQRYPAENVTIIFLTNVSANGYPLRDVLVIPGTDAAIERIVFGKEYSLPPWFMTVAPRNLESYAATYATSTGEEFVVTRDGDALRVAPRSQRAADLMFPAIKDIPAPDYSTYHEQIEKGLANYRDGKSADTKEAFPFEAKKLETQFGRFQSIEKIVTVPEVRNARNHQATTYAELRFERGLVTYRWHWWNGSFYEKQTPVPRQHLAFLPPFRAQSPTDFVGYVITLNMSLRVKFDIGTDGRPASMAIITSKGPVIAHRRS